MPDNTFWDDQANRRLQSPNLSPAQVRKIGDYVHDNKRAEEVHVWAMEAKTSEATKEIETRLKAEVKEALFGLQATVKEAKAHRIGYPELSARIEEHRKVLTSAEARLQSLESAVQKSEEILDDPHAYMASLYRRFPAIDNRPHLVEGIFDKS